MGSRRWEAVKPARQTAPTMAKPAGERATGAPVPPAGVGSELLRLQRSHGNRYVQRYLERIKEAGGAAPRAWVGSELLQLQRSHGNRYVQRYLQRSTGTGGPAGDRFERQADSVAHAGAGVSASPASRALGGRFGLTRQPRRWRWSPACGKRSRLPAGVDSLFPTGYAVRWSRLLPRIWATSGCTPTSGPTR
jgi:hypothetical protein